MAQCGTNESLSAWPREATSTGSQGCRGPRALSRLGTPRLPTLWDSGCLRREAGSCGPDSFRETPRPSLADRNECPHLGRAAWPARPPER